MGSLRSFYGPSKAEIWNQIARDVGGHYDDGGFWCRDALRCQSGEWEIILDTYTAGGEDGTLYTRMRAPFVNRDGLYLNIFREGFFASIGKFFGMQDIEINDPYFDDNFIIRGNNEAQIRLLLSDRMLKQLIQGQPDISFNIQDDNELFGTHFPKGVDMLHFQCVGYVRNKKRLKNLFDLFSLTLERLVQIDSAYEDDPRVKL